MLLSEQGLLPGQVPLLKQELLNPAEASASDPAEAPASAESGKSRSGRSLQLVSKIVYIVVCLVL